MHVTILKRHKSRFILSICFGCLLIEKFFSFFLLWEKAKWTLQRYFSLIIYQFCNKLKAQRKKRLYCIKLFLEDTQQKNKENVPHPPQKTSKASVSSSFLSHVVSRDGVAAAWESSSCSGETVIGRMPTCVRLNKWERCFFLSQSPFFYFYSFRNSVRVLFNFVLYHHQYCRLH